MSNAPDARRLPLTKIVATVGPATSSPDLIRKLVEAGVSVFRLNFSHGTVVDHKLRVQLIRAAARDFGQPVAILGDLQGPKIRVGKVAGEGIHVIEGQHIHFVRGTAEAQPPRADDPPQFTSTYPQLIDEVSPGQRLLINDGAVRLLIVSKSNDRIDCIVTPGSGGFITSSKGINLPDTDLSLPALGERDVANASWAIEHELDFLGLSFVRTAADVQSLREHIAGSTSRNVDKSKQSYRPSIIAKIETPAAVRNINDILEIADAIMIARGDLGVEMDLAEVPIVQKQLIRAADEWGKPCIVATQMLESMIASANPTRAEASDVANAILDGADAVMLSGETAVGKNPLLAVEAMRRIALCTEQFIASQPPQESPPARLVASRYRTAALAHGVWTIAKDIAAKFIAVWSQSGGGARYLSQNAFNIPIYAITSDEPAARRMQLLRSVVPLVMPVPESPAHFTRMIDAYLLEAGAAVAGDPCVLVAGGPLGAPGVTNSLAIHCVGDPTSGYLRFEA